LQFPLGLLLLPLKLPLHLLLLSLQILALPLVAGDRALREHARGKEPGQGEGSEEKSQERWN
jgi:hypothetical protein